MLVQADQISRWVEKFRGDLRRVCADGLHHLAAARDDGLESGSCAVHHHVHHETWRRMSRPPQHPGSADFTHSVVKGCPAFVVGPDFPAEHAFIEVRRAGDVRSGNLDVTNLAVSKSRRHENDYRRK